MDLVQHKAMRKAAVDLLVASWCFEPSQPLGVTSGLIVAADIFALNHLKLAHEGPVTSYGVT